MADLPLHGGKAPRWLFERMVRLARPLICIIVDEEGTDGFMRRLGDPFWFQAFGCALGFDWHSSGLTTTVCGAIKEALQKGAGSEIGLFAAGGKGATARRTPQEIEAAADRYGFDPAPLVKASRLSAKVDSAAVQDGYQLYHHLFLFDLEGRWGVIQQGMNDGTRYARRYHWVGTGLQSFVEEPHAAVCCDRRSTVLNLVALESDAARRVITELAKEHPDRIASELQRLPAARPRHLSLPARHDIRLTDLDPARALDVDSSRVEQALRSAYEHQPEDFQALLSLPGIGPATLRALALLAELAYGTPASTRDPARFSFAHGGKDGHPYPVDRRTYDRSIEFLQTALDRARVGDKDKLEAFRRLARLQRQAPQHNAPT